MTDEAKPQEMETLKPKIRRCIAMNEHGKMCRTRTRQDSYFCCESHTPKNLNNLKEECNICCEPVSLDDIIVLKCGHAQHKECFKTWISRPTSRYCPLCLTKIEINRQPKKKKKKEKKQGNPYVFVPQSPLGSPPPLVDGDESSEVISAFNQDLLTNILDNNTNNYINNLIEYNSDLNNKNNQTDSIIEDVD